MINRVIKNQKAGNNSTNVQTDSITINNGISYMEAKEIALDVFKDNFLQLTEQATRIARERAEEITTVFLNQLEVQNNEGIINAQDPDFQHALFTVQKEYARTGDKDLGDLLVDLLVDRTKHDKRTILQIVLNESLSVAPKLTIEQIASLSIVFLIKYTINRSLSNLPKLLNYFDSYFSPFASLLKKNASCFQHLEFAGCGTIGIGEVDIINVLKNNYKGLFSKGFIEEDFNQLNLNLADTGSFILPCLRDNTKWQVNAVNDEVLKDIANKAGVSEPLINSLISLNDSHLMSNDEIKEYIITEKSYMENVFEVWDKSYMKNFTLTSVGIAIGHANVKRSIGEFTDLSIWIN